MFCYKSNFAFTAEARRTQSRFTVKPPAISPMILIDNMNAADPAVNLSIEEYCLRHLDPKSDYLLLYINDPSVVIGKNQNPFQEADLAYAMKNSIRIVRRISGGGAVYHDHGNLNFSFMTGFGKEGLNDFSRLLEPVLLALDALGVNPRRMKNNTIFVEEKKISGNAQYTNLHRVLSHGTLLFDADLAALNRVLRSPSKICHSKGIASVPSTVTNISWHTEKMDIFAFKRHLIDAADRCFKGLETEGLSDAAWDHILRRAREKYQSWGWNYGGTPSFVVRHCLNGKTFRFHVYRGIIQKIEPEKERSGNRIATDLRRKLIGKRYDPEQLYETTHNRHEDTKALR